MDSVQLRDTNLIPERYPFIIVRREWFGGFLFNRFLSYTQLDLLQTRVLELCEGFLSIEQIIKIIRNEFKLIEPVVVQQLNNTFNLFDRYHAIYWREQRKSGDYFLPPRRLSKIKKNSRNLSAPMYVLWDITYACNFYCKHCLVEAGNTKTDPLPLVDIFKIIDELAEQKIFYINFLGGEPFMHPNIFEILAYASDFPIGISVTTNGSFVNKELVDKLVDLNLFDIQISIDGLEETHDSFRGVKGAFKKATEAVTLFSDAGFKTTINTVMTTLNIHELESLVNLALSLNATTFKAVAFLPVGRGKENYDLLLLKPEQLRENIRRLRNLRIKYKDVINILTEDNYPLFPEQDQNGTRVTGFSTIGCAAGITQLVIDPVGQTFSCPFLHEFLAGNLLHQSLKEIWENSEILNNFRSVEKTKLKGKCHTCQYLASQCKGGCRASAYAITGDLWEEDPLCWHKKVL